MIFAGPSALNWMERSSFKEQANSTVSYWNQSMSCHSKIRWTSKVKAKTSSGYDASEQPPAL